MNVMSFVDAKCTSCGEELRLDDSVETGFCMYCGNKIAVQDAIELRNIYDKKSKNENTSILDRLPISFVKLIKDFFQGENFSLFCDEPDNETKKQWFEIEIFIFLSAISLCYYCAANKRDDVLELSLLHLDFFMDYKNIDTHSKDGGNFIKVYMNCFIGYCEIISNQDGDYVKFFRDRCFDRLNESFGRGAFTDYENRIYTAAKMIAQMVLATGREH